MITKQYEVCLIDRNKFDDILNKSISDIFPTPDIDVGYGRGFYFPELNGYSTLNVIHVDFDYKLPTNASDHIIKKLEDELQGCEYIEDIYAGIASGTGNTTILIIFKCEVFDPSWDY